MKTSKDFKCLKNDSVRESLIKSWEKRANGKIVLRSETIRESEEYKLGVADAKIKTEKAAWNIICDLLGAIEGLEEVNKRLKANNKQ